MINYIRASLRDSKTARWLVLGIVSFTMLSGYYIADVMAPLQSLLERERFWSASEYGLFTSAYGWFNVFLLMLILAGIVLDKIGVRLSGFWAAIIMILGTAIKYWAISTNLLDGHTVLGINAQVFAAAMGYATFGVGVEFAGITVSKIIVRWFKGRELALAMGLSLATARMGTALALATSAPIAKALGGVAIPVLLGLLLLCIGLIVFLVFIVMDRKLDRTENQSDGVPPAEEQFRLRDIYLIIGNKGWWYIAILCVLFYSSVFPFLKYAANLMVNKFGIEPQVAGLIPSLLPFGTIILTPFFGNLYDKKGKGASIMIVGSLLIILVHLLFSIPLLNHWLIAIGLTITLGVGFSLVPSAMWPSVPKIIPEKQLGTAYALIFWVQNWGLMGVPALIGWVLDRYCIIGQTTVDGATVTQYDYTLPMLIFAAFGVLAIVFAFLLKAEDRKKGYGLEQPNSES